MSRVKKGLRVSIRVKLLALMAGVLLATMSVYLALAVKLITDDRMAYAFELNQKVADSLSAQVRATVDGLAERLRLYGGLVVTEEDAKVRQSLVAHLFKTEKDLIRIALHVRDKGGVLDVYDTIVESERLSPLEITALDLAELDHVRPFPLEALGREPVVINRSLPPSAPLLSIAAAEETRNGNLPGWVVAADIMPGRLLESFGGSDLYTAYLVDVEGHVITHPDIDKVVRRANLAGVSVVQAAIDSPGSRSGVLEFDDAQGHARLGAWAHVGSGRLSVITETDRAQALAATRHLVRLSALFGVAVVLAALLITILVARRLTTPISRLRHATAELASGRYEVDPQISSGDEIGELARDFRSMARELREGQLRLLQSEKMAAFGQLGAGITHEIKNPLGAIRGFAQLGRYNLENKEQVQEALEIIENETDRCLDIVQNFLRFARSDRGRHTRVDLNVLVEEGLKIVAHQLSVSGFYLHRQLGDDGEVMVSPGQIQQVMLNLLLNAEQASSRGGNIWVSTATLPDGWLEITIRDDGPGIPPELLARVFEPFFTTKAEDKGTGLGLSVSYGIIKDHGGELLVESEVGKGATFRIRLPAAPPGAEDG